MATRLSSGSVSRATQAHFLGQTWQGHEDPATESADARLGELVDSLNARVAHLRLSSSGSTNVRTAISAYVADAVDAEWYLNRYRDVADSGIGAEQHYEQYGRQEGRSPNSLSEKMGGLTHHLDGQWYLERYRDVADAGMDAQQHFEQHGRHEGRFPNRLSEKRQGLVEWFDAGWYLDRYLDIAQSGKDPREHYTAFGADEGRYPNATAESNAQSDGEDLIDFMSQLYKRYFGRTVDYFEFVTWRRFHKLGLTRGEMRLIVQHSAS